MENGWRFRSVGDAPKSHEVSTTCVSRWDQVSTQAESWTHPLTRMVLTNAALLRQQILKTQLSIVGLHVVRAVDSGDIQSFAHCIEMKTNNSRRETHRRDATLLRQATNS